MGSGSWWRRVHRHAGSTKIAGLDLEAPAMWVATEAPTDRLAIEEYRHAAMTLGGPIAVRTFVTEGLSAWRAPEVRVTIPVDFRETAVDVAKQMLAMQERFAAEGRPATLGGFTGFKTCELPGIELAGIVYARASSIPGIPKAGSALVAVLLHPEELAMVQQGLATRVLGLLAGRARMFPYPPCWEIRTTPVFRATDQAGSLIEQTPRAALGDVQVTVIGESLDDAMPVARLLLSVPADAAEIFATVWRDPAMRSLTLLAQLAPNADGQAIWLPGTTARHANAIGTTMPRRLGCAFVMLVGSDELPAQLSFIEDGAGLILANPMLDRVRDALITGKELTLQVDDQTELAVEFRSEIMADPFTGVKLGDLAEGSSRNWRH